MWETSSAYYIKQIYIKGCKIFSWKYGVDYGSPPDSGTVEILCADVHVHIYFWEKLEWMRELGVNAYEWDFPQELMLT